MDNACKNLMEFTFEPKEEGLLGFDEPLVSLIVGPKKVNLKVRKHVLAKIPVLDRMLNQKGFREGMSSTIELPEDNAAAVALVLDYYSSESNRPYVPSLWEVPSGSGRRSDPTYSTLPEPDERATQLEKQTLFNRIALQMRAFVFADKMLAPDVREQLFQNLTSAYERFPPSLAEVAALARLGHRHGALYACMICSMLQHNKKYPRPSSDRSETWRKRMNKHLEYLGQDDTVVDPDVAKASFDYMRATLVQESAGEDYYLRNDTYEYWQEADVESESDRSESAFEKWLKNIERVADESRDIRRSE